MKNIDLYIEFTNLEDLDFNIDLEELDFNIDLEDLDFNIDLEDLDFLNNYVSY
jgi:hypothetical protein